MSEAGNLLSGQHKNGCSATVVQLVKRTFKKYLIYVVPVTKFTQLQLAQT